MDIKSHASLLTALSILGSMSRFSSDGAVFIADLLVGFGDMPDYMRLIGFYRTHGRLPENLEELQACEKSNKFLENTRNFFRTALQNAASDAASMLAREAEEQRCKTHVQFLNLNKPAPEGTVAELAERYGKSKSEIRRLKAAGLLHTLSS